ncbi:MAG: hypothetical protein JWM15_60 [Cryptosporangiaceae bacterium]|jgi:hypothetical protein|nr:hypothetical protein [Cryptosporangiaceae bacterium]
MSFLSLRRWRVAATVLVAAALAVSMTGSAGASWTASGFGTGGSRADTLAPPASVTSACGLLDVGASSLTITWAKPSGTRFAAKSVLVERSTDGGVSWTTITSVLSTVAGAAGSFLFEDVGLTVLTTYHYRVTAVRGDWRASAPAPPRTIALGLLGLVNVCL